MRQEFFYPFLVDYCYRCGRRIASKIFEIAEVYEDFAKELEHAIQEGETSVLEVIKRKRT
ncbi:MAG TPA: hypothetical protein VI278_15050 [Nitrososphaeraceae archaeon]